MTRGIAGLLCLCCVWSSSIFAQGFTVKAKIKNRGNHTTLIAYQSGGKYFMDTSFTEKDGWIYFTGSVEEPVIASLVIRDPSLNIKRGEGIIPSPSLSFFLSNDEIIITGDAREIYKATVIGGKANNEWATLKAKQARLTGMEWAATRDYYGAKKKYTTEEKVEAVKQKAAEQDRKLKLRFISKNPASLVSVYLLTGLMNTLPLKELEQKFNTLSEESRQSGLAAGLRNKIEGSRATAVGNAAIELNKKDINGHPVTLAALKGKYVLLDFWGSWCGPCRQSHPHLKSLYEKYKSKGFEIVGIAQEQGSDLGKSRKSWLNAIEVDGIDWIQVLNNEDVQKFDVVKAYGVTAFPTKVLLDREGKIIARYVGDSEEIDRKLAELMGK